MLICTVPCAAQVIFFEDFSGPDVPSALTNLDLDALDANAANQAIWPAPGTPWVKFSDNNRDDLVAGTSAFVAGGTSDDWLILPPFTISSMTSFSWKAKSLYNLPLADGYEIRIAVGTITGVNDFLINPPLFSMAQENSDEFQARTVHLYQAGYTNQQVYIAIRHNSSYGGTILFDEIQLADNQHLIFDVALSAGRISEYAEIPVSQITPLVLSAKVSALQFNPVTQAQVTFNIYDEGSSLIFSTNSNVIDTLNPSQDSVLTGTTSFLPTHTGTYYGQYIVSIGQPFPDTHNDTTCTSIIVNDSVFARDEYTLSQATFSDGNLAAGIGTGVQFGQVFNLQNQDFLTSVTGFYDPLDSSAIGQSLSFSMYQFNSATGILGTLVASTVNYSIPDFTKRKISLNLLGGSQSISAGEYMVVGNNIPGLDFMNERFTPNTTWTNFGNGWVKLDTFQGGQFKVALMLRPNFGGNIISCPLIDLALQFEHDSCNTGQGWVTVTAIGGSSPYSHLWNNGSTTSTIQNLLANNYSVLVTDMAGCTADTFVVLIDSCPPTPCLPINLMAFIEPDSCGNAVGSISLNATGSNPPFDFIWNNGQTGNILQNLLTGTYSVIITDAVGCTSDTTFDVTNDCFICEPVQNTWTDKVTINTARLLWNPAPQGHHYEIRGRASGNSNWVILPIFTGQPNFKNVAGLSNNITYEWQIKAYCNAADSVGSAWSSLISFTTGCYAPDSMWVAPVTANGARLNWMNVVGSTGYQIRGHRLGTTGFVTITIGPASTFKDVFGLLSNTTYEWTVRSLCNANGTLGSGYPSMIPFTTLSGVRTHSQIGVSTWLEQTKLTINPNPAYDITQIHFPNAWNEMAILNLFDLAGKEVKVQIQEIDANSITLNLQELTPGIYFIRLKTHYELITRRLMILSSD